MVHGRIYDVVEQSISMRASSIRMVDLLQRICHRQVAHRHSFIVMIVCFSLMMGQAVAMHYKKPSWLNPCHRSDPKLNQCLQSSMNKIIQTLKNGIPEYKISSLDPIELAHLRLENVGTTNITLELNHSLIKGLADIRVVNVKPNLEENKLEFALKCPNATVEGYFQSEGGILMYPLVSQGAYSINIQDISGMCIIYFDRITKPMKTLFVDRMDIDIMTTSVLYHFGEELNGDRSLGIEANHILNENALEFFKLVKPNIIRGATEVFTAIANQVLNNFPEELLLPP